MRHVVVGQYVLHVPLIQIARIKKVYIVKHLVHAHHILKYVESQFYVNLIKQWVRGILLPLPF
jgi:hypothetical protein